ncbi:MAG: hypothetical protein NDJ89_15805 [Oligoflexia bacterium]|nr:hypothetical protein [Oligoflexia bacterium]
MAKRTAKIATLAAWLALFTLWGCNQASMDVPFGRQSIVTEGAVSYETHILPLFQRSCSTCHNASSAIPNWLSYEVAYSKRDRIHERVVVRRDMPMVGTLTQEERDLVAAWIAAGAPKTLPAGIEPAPAPPAPLPTATSPAPAPSPVADAPTTSTGPINYVTQIQPLFSLKCSMCHNPSSAVPNWLDYNVAFANRAKIRDRIFVRRDMPLIGSLTDEERKLVADWVDAGAPYAPEGGAVPPPPSPAPPPSPKPLTYDDLMKPRIFGAVCIACHNGSNDLPNWQSYSVVCREIDKIYREVVERKTMPKDMPFADSERQLMADWIRAGAPESTTSGPCDRLN